MTYIKFCSTLGMLGTFCYIVVLQCIVYCAMCVLYIKYCRRCECVLLGCFCVPPCLRSYHNTNRNVCLSASSEKRTRARGINGYHTVYYLNTYTIYPNRIYTVCINKQTNTSFYFRSNAIRIPYTVCRYTIHFINV